MPDLGTTATAEGLALKDLNMEGTKNSSHSKDERKLVVSRILLILHYKSASIKVKVGRSGHDFFDF